jgi:CheY-like chemotaxis protein
VSEVREPRPRLSQPRVLVVDDSIVVRRILVLTLRQLPEFFYAQVDEAGNGALGLRQIESMRYDLVLSDVRMPYMDGLEMVRRVRALGDTTTPIVLISTLGSQEDVQRGEQAGADAYILKPIVPAVIRAALREFLEHLTRQGRFPASARRRR